MKAKLIIVDDEKDILENFHDLLNDEYEIQTFSHPRDFLNYVAAERPHPHLLLTDLKMQSMDGIDMIKEAQKLGFDSPFIILSGHLDKSAALEAVDQGVFRILEKPCEQELLLRTIEETILEAEGHRVRREIRHLTSQLRELYTGIRFTLLQYIPEDVIDRLVVDAPHGKVKEKMSFEKLLEQLESRLDQLLKSEQVFEQLKKKKDDPS
ncbi:MAG: response regulator [Proteobacteria bacterium]|jgi:FixJ family two-component response regulator|nr:response regulator [Pseudomonadota bacterium]